MDKVQASVRSIRSEISKAEKKLRVLRSRVGKAEKKKINLELRLLGQAKAVIPTHCFVLLFGKNKEK
jgi:hypothetical protein